MSKKYIVNKVGGGIMVPSLLPLFKKQLSFQIKNGYQPIVVVSAVKDVTDIIINFLKDLSQNKKTQKDISIFIKHLQNRHTDLFGTLEQPTDIIFEELTADLNNYIKQATNELEAKITAYGEKLSAACAAQYFSTDGLKSQAVLAEDIPIITDEVLKDANIIYEESEKNIKKYLKNIKTIPVVAGFTGRTSTGTTTLLGRGGTDTTACFVGAALRASKVVLWKDVGAIYSADPKLIKSARTIPLLSYDEIEEAGKIIQGKAVRYLRQNKIDAEIASLKNSKDKTTVRDGHKTKPGAKMVSFKKNLTLFSLRQGEARGYERLTEISDLCARYKVNVVLIWNDPVNLHVAVEDTSGLLNQLIEEVKNKFSQISTMAVHMVTIVGNFNWHDVNKFNQVLFGFDKEAMTGAFPYPQCMRMEGIVAAKHDIIKLLGKMHKIFIK
jgi:aspartate kinase